MDRIVSYRSRKAPSGRTLFYVSFDGKVPGDSRSYETAETARDEALKVVQSEQDAATAAGRFAALTYRPGY